MKPIITLTTIPTRLKTIHEYGLKYCIESLMNQNCDDYEIHFNIPLVNRLTNKEYGIPEWLQEQVGDKLKIFRIQEDIGPLTKLIPTLERINDPEQIIIVLDDDLVYHPDLINEHLNNQVKWDLPVGYDGIHSIDVHFEDMRDHFCTSNYMDTRVNVLQHYKSVSYKRRHFGDDFVEFCMDNFSWSDDLVVAAYFSSKKITRIATYHVDDPQFNSLEEWQSRGGVTTFPVIRHTAHETFEGCNLYRQNEVEDNSHKLHIFINNGY
jgi:hypothetical protein